MKTAIFTQEQLMLKIKQYCAYQERCNMEVREKLYSFGLDETNTAQIINQLTQENYLNEARFAIQYAGSKFRMKHWGAIKIKFALKQKQVNAAFIKAALDQIDKTDYLKTLDKLATQKLKTLGNEKNVFSKKRKLYDYLAQKGYEGSLIKEVIEKKYNK